MSETTLSGPSGIGLLNEKPLHAALKEWYAAEGEEFEASVDGYVIDLLQGDRLVEFQCRNFSSLKKKMRDLTERHNLRLVYPIAREKWIVKLAPEDGARMGRRKSPKRGRVEDLFSELVSFPELIARPKFSLEVLLIREEEVRRYDPKQNWRRKGWGTHERRLLEVVDRKAFETPADLVSLVPAHLEDPFTTAELAAATGVGRRLAQQMAYCLRKMDAIRQDGKRGNEILYRRDVPPS